MHFDVNISQYYVLIDWKIYGKIFGRQLSHREMNNSDPENDAVTYAVFSNDSNHSCSSERGDAISVGEFL